MSGPALAWLALAGGIVAVLGVVVGSVVMVMAGFLVALAAYVLAGPRL